jgi:hypothetical protein
MRVAGSILFLALVASIVVGPADAGPAPQYAAATPAAAATPTQTSLRTPIPGATATPRQTQTPIALGAAAPWKDAYALLEASSSAMGRVRSWRFSGAIDVRFADRGTSFSQAMPVSGEGAQDRQRLVVEVPMMGRSVEMIMIGDQVWMRMGERPWESASWADFGVPVDPFSVFKPTSGAQLARYLLNAQLSEVGAAYRVSADLDASQSVAELGDQASGLGSEAFARMGLDLSAMKAQMVLTINKSTLYIETMELAITMSLPAGQGPVTGALPIGGEASVAFRLNLSGFNDPAIDIQPPSQPGGYQ